MVLQDLLGLLGLGGAEVALALAHHVRVHDKETCKIQRKEKEEKKHD